MGPLNWAVNCKVCRDHQAQFLKSCSSFQDELHRLFQFIHELTCSEDCKDHRGYLETKQITTFQHIVAQTHKISVNKAEESQVLVRFLQNQGDEAASQMIDWSCFQQTLTDWVIDFTNLPRQFLDFGGLLSLTDRKVLHLALSAFFTIHNLEKTDEILKIADGKLENLEGDTRIVGLSFFIGNAPEESDQNLYDASLSCIQNFGTIVTNITSGLIQMNLTGWQQLHQMLRVVEIIQHKHNIEMSKPQLSTIFASILNSQVLLKAPTILQNTYYPEQPEVVELKLKILQCISLLTHGLRLFGSCIHTASAEDVQAEAQHDQAMCQRLRETLMEANLLNSIFGSLVHPDESVKQMAFVLAGHYLREGLDLREFFFQNNYLAVVFNQYLPSQSTETLTAISWFLFLLFREEIGESTALTTRQIQLTETLLPLLTSILTRQDNSDKLVYCVLLTLQYVLPVHPPNDWAASTFAMLSQKMQELTFVRFKGENFDPNLENWLMPHVILKIFYFSVKNSKHHLNFLVNMQPFSIQSLCHQILAERRSHSSDFFGVLQTALSILEELAEKALANCFMSEKEVVENLFSICEDPQGLDQTLLPQVLRVIEKALTKSEEPHYVVAFFAFEHNAVSKLISSTSRLAQVSSVYITEAYEGVAREVLLLSHEALDLRVLALVKWLQCLQSGYQVKSSAMPIQEIFIVDYLDSFSFILSQVLDLIPKLRCVDPIRLGSIEILQAFFGELKLKIEMSRSKSSFVHDHLTTKNKPSAQQDLHEVVSYIDKLNSFQLHIQAIVEEFQTEQDLFLIYERFSQMNISLQSSRSSTSGILLNVKCVPYPEDGEPEENLQVPANIEVEELQSLINKRFNCQTLLYFEDDLHQANRVNSGYYDAKEKEDPDGLTALISNLDLRRAVQRAAKQAFTSGTNKTNLIIFVARQFNERFFCSQCREEFTRDQKGYSMQERKCLQFMDEARYSSKQAQSTYERRVFEGLEDDLSDLINRGLKICDECLEDLVEGTFRRAQRSDPDFDSRSYQSRSPLNRSPYESKLTPYADRSSRTPTNFKRTSTFTPVMKQSRPGYGLPAGRNLMPQLSMRPSTHGKFINTQAVTATRSKMNETALTSRKRRSVSPFNV